MDMVHTLKTEYNKVLTRWNKATSYLEAPERTNEEVEQWLPEYEAMLKQRMALCNDIAEYSGARPTLSEFENGFGGSTTELREGTIEYLLTKLQEKQSSNF